MFPSVDFEQARSYKKYLIHSYKRFAKKEEALADIKQQVKKLKKMATPGVQERIKLLEQKIKASAEKEKELERHLADEMQYHTKLQDKITALHTKLDTFLATKHKRLKRAKELEEKVFHLLAGKREKLKRLKQDLAMLEKIHKQLQKEKKHPAHKIKKVNERIQDVHKKIKKMEKGL